MGPTTKNPYPTLFAYNSFKQPSTPRAESRHSQAVQGQLTTPKRSTTHQPRRLRVGLPMGCTQLEAINCQPSTKLTKVDSHKGHLGSEVEIGPSNETGSGSLSEQSIMLDLYLCISHFIGYAGLWYIQCHGKRGTCCTAYQNVSNSSTKTLHSVHYYCYYNTESTFGTTYVLWKLSALAINRCHKSSLNKIRQVTIPWLVYRAEVQ